MVINAMAMIIINGCSTLYNLSTESLITPPIPSCDQALKYGVVKYNTIPISNWIWLTISVKRAILKLVAEYSLFEAKPIMALKLAIKSINNTRYAQ